MSDVDVTDDSEDEDHDDDSEEESSVRRAFVHVIGDYVALDDDEATMVVVFPRGRGFGGGKQAVDPEQLVKMPWEQAAKIFRWDGAFKTGFQDFPQDRSKPIPQLAYQNAIRDKVVDTMLSMGLKLKSFESIDGDETYLKLTLDPDGQVLRHLAHCFRYKVPLTRETYKQMRHPYVGFPTGVPPRNAVGHEVFAYTEYTSRMADKFQPFRDVDMIRLVTRLLNQHLSFAELQRQNVISRCFPAAKHQDLVDLHDKWVLPKKFTFCRTSIDDDPIRDYFGEEVAFFFQFFAFYIRMLVGLALVAGLVFLIDNGIHIAGISFDFRFKYKAYCKLGFGLVLVIWASVVEVLFQSKSARSRQRWGMDSGVASADETLPDYRMELEGTWRLTFQKMFSHGCVIAACILFSVVWGNISTNYKKGKEALMTSLLIRVCSIAWSYVVPLLARLQNHRTNRRRNKAMTAQLAVVKLFLYLSPFLRTAFLVNWTQMTCAPTLRRAANKAFKEGWPTGVNASNFRKWLPEYVVPEKIVWAGINFPASQPEKKCIWGCQPVRCMPDRRGGSANCRTSCYDTLRANLDSLYFTHAGFSLLFLFIAIVYAHCKARAEMKKPTQDQKEYTYLQFQAKCDEVCRYEYLSWGGSYVEDFLEVVLGFALISCFGIIRPAITPVVLIMQIVEYRLLAYRMTHVTARPYPTGSTGIDMWNRILELISVLSAGINALVAAFLVPPFTRWKTNHKIILFFVYSIMMLGARYVVKALTRRTPADVSLVGDFNQEFLTKVSREQAHLDLGGTIPAGVEEDIDVGLRPPTGSPKAVTGSRSFSLLGML